LFITYSRCLKGLVDFDAQQKKMFSFRILPCNCEVRGHCNCKEMPVILVDRVVAKKRIIGKNVGPRRRRGARGR
jgi:hypothetical protein